MGLGASFECELGQKQPLVEPRFGGRSQQTLVSQRPELSVRPSTCKGGGSHLGAALASIIPRRTVRSSRGAAAPPSSSLARPRWRRITTKSAASLVRWWIQQDDRVIPTRHVKQNQRRSSAGLPRSARPAPDDAQAFSTVRCCRYNAIGRVKRT